MVHRAHWQISIFNLVPSRRRPVPQAAPGAGTCGRRPGHNLIALSRSESWHGDLRRDESVTSLPGQWQKLQNDFKLACPARRRDSEGTRSPVCSQTARTVISNVRRTFLCATQYAHFAVRRTVHCVHSMLMLTVILTESHWKSPNLTGNLNCLEQCKLWN